MRATALSTLLIVFAAACGGSSSPTARVEPDPGPPVRSATDDEPEPARDLELQAALARFCDVVGVQLNDRSRPLAARQRAIREWIESDGARERLEDVFADAGTYAGAVGAAHARGASFDCPAAAQLERLVNDHDPDIDPAAAASFADDATRLCDIAGSPELAAEDIEHRSMRFEGMVDETITNGDLRLALEAARGSPPEVRFQMIVDLAREQGVRRFRCAPLEQMWGR
jgi:hypothetical protein